MKPDLSAPVRRDYTGEGLTYAQQVVSGDILACKWVRLACERQLRDLERKGWAYAFDPMRGDRVCRFIEQLPHVKGEWAARQEKLKLQPWQCFLYTTAFGWIHFDDPDVRRFRIVYIAVPRKNAKSTLAAGTALYMLSADGEYGAEVYAGATSRRQAGEVYRPARQMVERTKGLQEAFGVRPGSQRLSVQSTGSFMETLVRSPGDGQSPSCAVVDEYHEHKNDILFDAMRSGMGARKRPLLWCITTAGTNTGGPCRLFQSDIERMLEGHIEQEDTFGLIYTIDDDDDWTSETALRKANPNYGISISPTTLRGDQQAAIQSAHKQAIFQTKHLNVWVGALNPFLNLQKWKLLADPSLKLEDFAEEPCWIGTDLSSSIDIADTVKVFRRIIDGIPHFYVFARHYLPLSRIEDPEMQHYRGWLRDGFLIGTPGETIDFVTIRRDLMADVEWHNVRAIAFDPWAALETQQELTRELGDQRVVSVPMQTRYLSYPMKQLEALTLAGQIHHTGDPILTWMMGNLVAKEDANSNVFPRKEKPENKIDGAVAAILALSRCLADAPQGPQEIEIW